MLKIVSDKYSEWYELIFTEPWYPPRESLDHKISFYFHKHFSGSHTDQENNKFLERITKFWKFISILNDHFVWITILMTFYIISFTKQYFPFSDVRTLSVALDRKNLHLCLFFLFFDFVLVQFMKVVFKKGRPVYLSQKSKEYREKETVIDSYGSDQYAFPSNHSSIIASASVLYFYVWGVNFFLYFLMIFTILIGIARISLAKHYFYDVVGGFCIGHLESLFFISIIKTFH